MADNNKNVNYSIQGKHTSVFKREIDLFPVK